MVKSMVKINMITNNGPHVSEVPAQRKMDLTDQGASLASKAISKERINVNEY